LSAILAERPEAGHEIVVVDDASTDSTPEVLQEFGDAVRVVRRPENGGFATACNDGAAAARGDFLVFLNNDTLPREGWLDALVAHAELHPPAAVIGSKLLYPNDTVQHAGVVICQDGNPRHLYAGFPADHPAVNKARRFQAVTAGCALIRRRAFEQVGGFDAVFRNCLEDADLCLRLGELGWEVWYCPTSVLYHLESVSRGRRSKDIERNAMLFRARWAEKAHRDDLDYYRQDGLLRVRYEDTYPVGFELSPDVAVLRDEDRVEERERILDTRSRQVAELLKETVRLTARIAELELGGVRSSAAGPHANADTGLPGGDIGERSEQIEMQIHDLQENIATLLRIKGANGSTPGGAVGFEASEYLAYRKLVQRIRELVASRVPQGATLVVASKGDDALLELAGVTAWHFPRDDSGTYAGHYPSDDDGAIAQLEELRDRGAAYFLLPATALWWRTEYPGFGKHLDEQYSAIAEEPETGVLYALGGRRRARLSALWRLLGGRRS
jgi:GT2 family glycosyltransferase